MAARSLAALILGVLARQLQRLTDFTLRQLEAVEQTPGAAAARLESAPAAVPSGAAAMTNETAAGRAPLGPPAHWLELIRRASPPAMETFDAGVPPAARPFPGYQPPAGIDVAPATGGRSNPPAHWLERVTRRPARQAVSGSAPPATPVEPPPVPAAGPGSPGGRAMSDRQAVPPLEEAASPTAVQRDQHVEMVHRSSRRAVPDPPAERPAGQVGSTDREPPAPQPRHRVAPQPLLVRETRPAADAAADPDVVQSATSPPGARRAARGNDTAGVAPEAPAGHRPDQERRHTASPRREPPVSAASPATATASENRDGRAFEGGRSPGEWRREPGVLASVAPAVNQRAPTTQAAVEYDRPAWRRPAPFSPPERLRDHAGWPATDSDDAGEDELSWPELPGDHDVIQPSALPAPLVDDAVVDEVAAAWRTWERLQRLEREQRGTDA